MLAACDETCSTPARYCVLQLGPTTAEYEREASPSGPTVEYEVSPPEESSGAPDPAMMPRAEVVAQRGSSRTSETLVFARLLTEAGRSGGTEMLVVETVKVALLKAAGRQE